MGGPNVGGAAHLQTVSLLHQSFKNPNWPPNYINADNVLDYFCDPGNVFYDVSSCNQHIRMQSLNRPLHECLQFGLIFFFVLISNKIKNYLYSWFPFSYYFRGCWKIWKVKPWIEQFETLGCGLSWQRLEIPDRLAIKVKI